MKLKRRHTTILLMVIFIFGVALILYPTISDYWNSFHASRAIAGYAEQVSQIDTSVSEKVFAEASAYNATLQNKAERFRFTEEDAAVYNKLLNVTGTGIMGYIDIPSIKVELPVYHGTDDAVLQIAIGHIEGTSLPVGGKGTHSVLSGHRGLPSAKLFTDIDQLEVGDEFFLQIVDQTLAYEVDQIHIVLPSEMSDLYIDPEQDYCTLVTCTPYGINTHRLLVRGHRIEFEGKKSRIRVTNEALQISPNVMAAIFGTIILIFVVIIFYIATCGRYKEEERAEEEKIEEEKIRSEEELIDYLLRT